MNWLDKKRWSDRFMPEIKRILGEHLIGAAPLMEDQRHNTDLIVLKLEAVRVACRIRKYEYFEKYPHDFTVRAGLPSGVETELAKIIRGWGDYFFYGFADASEKQLQSWILGDLGEFRLWYMRKLAANETCWSRESNGTGDSWFMAFDTRFMPDQFFVARAPMREAA